MENINLLYLFFPSARVCQLHMDSWHCRCGKAFSKMGGGWPRDRSCCCSGPLPRAPRRFVLLCSISKPTDNIKGLPFGVQPPYHPLFSTPLATKTHPFYHPLSRQLAVSRGAPWNRQHLWRNAGLAKGFAICWCSQGVGLTPPNSSPTLPSRTRLSCTRGPKMEPPKGEHSESVIGFSSEKLFTCGSRFSVRLCQGCQPKKCTKCWYKLKSVGYYLQLKSFIPVLHNCYTQNIKVYIYIQF